MILSMSVVSCMPEPDGPSKPEADKPGVSDSTSTAEIVKAVADFDLYLSDGFLKLYDVKAEITIDGKKEEETITGEHWRYLRILAKDEIPSTISCRVVGVAKDPLPEMEEQTLKLRSSKICRAYLVDENNVEKNAAITFSKLTDISGITIASSKAQQYVSERPVEEFINVTYEYNK